MYKKIPTGLTSGVGHKEADNGVADLQLDCDVLTLNIQIPVTKRYRPCKQGYTCKLTEAYSKVMNALSNLLLLRVL